MTPIEQDFDEMILQITADLRSKEDRIRSTTARGIQLDNLSADFSYVRRVSSHRFQNRIALKTHLESNSQFNKTKTRTIKRKS